MGVPYPVQASAGTAITAGTGTVSLTGCTAGNVVAICVVEDGLGDDLSGGNISNVETFAGVDNDIDNLISLGFVGFTPKTGTITIWVGRVMANGTISMDITVGASGDDLFAQWYEFGGARFGTTVASLFEHGEATWSAGAGNGTTVGNEDLTSNGQNRLGLCFMGLDDDQNIGNLTGWMEFSEFASSTGTQATLQLQTAVMPIARTIPGSATTIGASAAFGSTSTALIGAPDSGDDPPIGVLGRGAGW